MSLERGKLNVEFVPIQFEGVVIKGFGRGSTQLGCPTANISIEPYRDVLDTIDTGVYWGFGRIGDDKQSNRYVCAINIGWSPYYQNPEKTIEAHLCAKLDDFYGEFLRMDVMGYIRPEASFETIDALKQAIADDIKYAKAKAREV